jgi:hypoxanthine phosphoribosyltransferase
MSVARGAGGAILVPPEGFPPEPHERALHERLTGDGRVERVLVPRSLLRRRVAELARELRAAQPDLREFHFVVVLKGALAFGKDLGEALFELDGSPVRFSYLKASTYGDEIKGAGEAVRRVRIELRPGGLAGRDVILVEDLVDQGFTLAALRRYLVEEERVASVRACVLLSKRVAPPRGTPGQASAAPPLEQVGFDVPDRWVAGYGMDAGEDFRNLPFLVTVNEAHYRGSR